MKIATILALATMFHFTSTAQEFFSPTGATASKKEHLIFMTANKVETEKRAGIWKVPRIAVQLITSVQSGAGTQSGFNYGAVLPVPQITKYAKFAKVDHKGWVACEKKSRGFEATALALNAIKSKTGFKNDIDLLTFVFGANGDLSTMATEAEKAYKAYTGTDIILAPEEVAPPKLADVPEKAMATEVKVITGAEETPNPANNNGRRIIKDPLKEIAVIETYKPGNINVIKKEKQDTIAEAPLTVRPEIELTEEEMKSKEKNSEEKIQKHYTAAEKAALREAELKKAAMTEAEKREAKLKKAEELVMKQRAEAQKKRADKKKGIKE